MPAPAADTVYNTWCQLHGILVQTNGMSAVYSFLTAEPVGAASTVHFLAMADLGHTTLDSADEYDYDESDDVLNYDPEGTPERVGPLPASPLHALPLKASTLVSPLFPCDSQITGTSKEYFRCPHPLLPHKCICG